MVAPSGSGTTAPSIAVPAGACDAHMHIYDARFAHSGSLAAHAGVDDYRALQSLLGTQRSVVVTPRPYGTDNQVTLDAVARLGRDRTRSVARGIKVD